MLSGPQMVGTAGPAALTTASLSQRTSKISTSRAGVLPTGVARTIRCTSTSAATPRRSTAASVPRIQFLRLHFVCVCSKPVRVKLIGVQLIHESSSKRAISAHEIYAGGATWKEFWSQEPHASLGGDGDSSKHTGVQFAGKKTVSFPTFNSKTIILPRQARDKHRESTQKRDHFAR